MKDYPPRLIGLAVALAALAGFVDAIAFTRLGGYFVSFMSGNSTRLGVGIGLADGTAALAILPSMRATSTSTVGLPRESRISRAATCSMMGTGFSLLVGSGGIGYAG